MDYASLGRRIREKRKKKSVTQTELASQTGISAVHISNIELGNTRASLSTIVSIANALGTSLDELACDSLESTAFIYVDSIYSMFEECNHIEIKIISETVDALRKSLKKNNI